MSDDLYLQQVRGAALRAKSGKSEVIFNRSREHAAMLISELIGSATSEVSILAGCLDKDVYESKSVIDAAKEAINANNVTFRVLLDGRMSSADAKRAEVFVELLKDRLDTKSEETDVVRLLPKSEYKNFDSHFIVVDNHAYRFEPNWQKTEAFANFYDVETGDSLNKWFTSLWDKYRQIDKSTTQSVAEGEIK
jgi:hypothetical protein